MLTTKDIAEAKVPKTLGPGNHAAKISRIELGKGYNAGSYHVYLHVEGEDQGPDFEGFFKDAESKTGPRYQGQVGRVRMSAYAFEDGVTKTGIPVNRDRSILRGLQNLAKVLGKQEELDKVEADTIEEYVPLASAVLSGNTFLNWCFAGKEYEKGGYTNYDLYLPSTKGGGFAYEAQGVTSSKLIQFDAAKHITGKTQPQPVESFEPEKTDDFNL